jgi:putative membrane protein
MIASAVGLTMIVASLSGLPAFIAYFIAAILLSVAFVLSYTAITPNKELELIRTGNTAAAIEVGMSLIGFSIPLASAIFHAGNLIDCMIWGVVALMAQLSAYLLARFAHRSLPAGIAKNDIASGVFVGCVSLAAGILSAACMSY